MKKLKELFELLDKYNYQTLFSVLVIIIVLFSLIMILTGTRACMNNIHNEGGKARYKKCIEKMKPLHKACLPLLYDLTVSDSIIYKKNNKEMIRKNDN